MYIIYFLCTLLISYVHYFFHTSVLGAIFCKCEWTGYIRTSANSTFLQFLTWRRIWLLWRANRRLRRIWRVVEIRDSRRGRCHCKARPTSKVPSGEDQRISLDLNAPTTSAWCPIEEAWFFFMFWLFDPWKLVFVFVLSLARFTPYHWSLYSFNAPFCRLSVQQTKFSIKETKKYQKAMYIEYDTRQNRELIKKFITWAIAKQ